MQIGNNAAAMLKGFIDDVYALKVDERAAKESRKALVEDLKEESLSASVLLRIMKQDDEKVAEQNEMLKKCGALLGRTVYTEEFSSEDAQELAETLGEEVKDYTTEKVQSLLATDEDIRAIGVSIKDKLKEAKKVGFDGNVILTVVDFRLDPKKAEKFQQRSLLLTKYLEVVGG